MAGLIFLDTHVVVWLYAGQLERFGAELRQDLNDAALRISPAVTLEAQYLHEIGRLSVSGQDVIEELQRSIGLAIDDTPFEQVVAQSLDNTWTRDPFDRLIVAQAALGNYPLLSKDRHIREHYEYAYWRE
ncbi:MAG: PIN domain nuclease of toxin-antitoxin system [Planctomycetota bacterium]|jgi:PIN domain nuclease of toxin-antitoxin system